MSGDHDIAPPATVDALIADLSYAIGEKAVSVTPAARRAASTDWAHMSPILAARLPAGLADVVVYPGTPEQITTAVRLAHRYGVPITPRGQGTGNYGQGIPLANGLVIDTSRCNRVLSIGDGWIRAQPGTSFTTLEAAAHTHGQELAILPSTVGSTIGGFIAGGSGGTGSIENGWTWDGYVQALDLVPCTDEAAVTTFEGASCEPFHHAYGVTGLIGTATVTLVPRRDWTALFAAFTSEPAAVHAARRLMRMDPPPRIVSLDEPGIVATYPDDPAMPPGKHSVRAVIDRSTHTSAATVITDCGGTVEAIRPKAAAYLASLSFNHVTHRARKARPELCHLQVAGDALTERADDVRAVLPGTLLHLDGFRTHPPKGTDPRAGRELVGMLLCRFEDAHRLYEGVTRLRRLGVLVDDPHTWLLHHNLDRIREAALRFDPGGLLNPGKLPPSGNRRARPES